MSESNVGGKLCEPGDLVLNRLKAHLGVLALSPTPGIVSPDYTVFRPIGTANHRYFCALYRSPYCGQELHQRAKGIVEGFWRLYTDDFYDIRVPMPPPTEQAAIVRFLDWADGRLERTIRAKRKVIALLNEQKQGLIHRAVTRGLDAAPLRPSGVPWLGDIPQHWEVRRLGHISRLQTGFPFASTGFVSDEGGTRLLRGINVTPSGIRWDHVVRWQRTPNDGLDEFALVAGDLVLGMDRPIIRSGVRVARIMDIDSPSLLLQRVARIQAANDLESEFLLLLLRGRLFRDYMEPLFTGISVPHLSPKQIKDFHVPFPPLKEQQAIVRHLRAETGGLDISVAHLERELELLKEYRTRLVADVVTGRLDVREAAARLPNDSASRGLANDTEDDAADDVESSEQESGE